MNVVFFFFIVGYSLYKRLSVSFIKERERVKEKEREREKKREIVCSYLHSNKQTLYAYMHLYIHIFIFIYGVKPEIGIRRAQERENTHEY